MPTGSKPGRRSRPRTRPDGPTAPRGPRPWRQMRAGATPAFARAGGGAWPGRYRPDGVLRRSGEFRPGLRRNGFSLSTRWGFRLPRPLLTRRGLAPFRGWPAGAGGRRFVIDPMGSSSWTRQGPEPPGRGKQAHLSRLLPRPRLGVRRRVPAFRPPAPLRLCHCFVLHPRMHIGGFAPNCKGYQEKNLRTPPRPAADRGVGRAGAPETGRIRGNASRSSPRTPPPPCRWSARPTSAR